MAQDHQKLSEAAIGERVQSVLAGDPAALDQWYRAEHPEVYRLCVGFLADVAEAEDTAQDALLHLRDRLASWDAARPGSSGSPGRPWRAWRDTVVLNLCRDRLRRRTARERAHRRAALEAREDQGLAPGVLPDPSAEAQRTEVRALLEEVLQELPTREREAFVLRDLEQLSSAQTAERMGIEASSVRSLLTLARRRLRQLLSARSPGLGGGDGHD